MAQIRDIMVADPFAALGVAEDAGDEAIRRRYLALVRAFPPDREPARFEAYRAACETIRDARARAELRLLHSTDAALARLKRSCLEADATAAGAIPEAIIAALIAEGLKHGAPDDTA